MSRKSTYYIASTTALTSYFILGLLLVDHDLPASLPEWILLTASLLVISFSGLYLLLRPHYSFYSNRSFKFIKRTSFFSETDTAYLFSVLPVILYLQLWWYKLGIISWSAGFTSAENFFMMLFSIILGALLFEYYPERQDTSSPVKSLLKINMGRKIFFWKPFFLPLVLYILFIRLLISFSPNDSTSAIMEKVNSGKYSSKETLALVTVDDVSIKDFIDRLMDGRLPNFRKVTGEAVIGIIIDSLRTHNLEEELFINDNIDVSDLRNYPVTITDHSNPVLSFLRSLILMPDNRVIGKLRSPSKKQEPFWDTAERYGYSTGLINMPLSQQYAENGFYVSDRYFSTLFSQDPISADSELYIYPGSLSDSLKSIKIPLSGISSDDLPVNRRQKMIRQFDLISKTSLKLQILKRPDLLMINIETGKFKTGEDSVSNDDTYKILDDFVGSLHNDLLNNYRNFVLVGNSQKGDSNEYGFIIARGPAIQDSEKLISVEYERLLSDLNYILGLPLLEKYSTPIDTVLFRKNHLAFKPPEYVKHYPPLLKIEK
ncbi:MAG: hypothetical protein GY863_08755 [bacterium]|nr:hypothetical protein [bacterium]